MYMFSAFHGSTQSTECAMQSRNSQNARLHSIECTRTYGTNSVKCTGNLSPYAQQPNLLNRACDILRMRVLPMQNAKNMPCVYAHPRLTSWVLVIWEKIVVQANNTVRVNFNMKWKICRVLFARSPQLKFTSGLHRGGGAEQWILQLPYLPNMDFKISKDSSCAVMICFCPEMKSSIINLLLLCVCIQYLILGMCIQYLILGMFNPLYMAQSSSVPVLLSCNSTVNKRYNVLCYGLFFFLVYLAAQVCHTLSQHHSHPRWCHCQQWDYSLLPVAVYYGMDVHV